MTSHHGLDIVGYRRATYALQRDAKLRNVANPLKLDIIKWIVVCNSTA